MMAVEEALPTGEGWAYKTKWDGFRVPAGRALWVASVLVGQVGYQQFTSDHRLRHTAWRGLRDDVRVSEVLMSAQ